jgi:hypothetical protein
MEEILTRVKGALYSLHALKNSTSFLPNANEVQ